VPGETGLAEDLDTEVDRTAGRLDGIAAALSAEAPAGARTAPPENEAGELRTGLERRADALRATPGDADSQARFVYAALVWHWLREVAHEAGDAEGLVGNLTPVGSA
jgi:hypothetical protein